MAAVQTKNTKINRQREKIRKERKEKTKTRWLVNTCAGLVSTGLSLLIFAFPFFFLSGVNFVLSRRRERAGQVVTFTDIIFSSIVCFRFVISTRNKSSAVKCPSLDDKTISTRLFMFSIKTNILILNKISPLP